ncbi:MAG: hypothetical protein EOM20_01590 [Spartobacteria bacterium]|nr:hypothetical protein [Spartobacteria bacterium]
MKDPYITLGIHEKVTDQDVQDAYHRCLRKYPPEENPRKFADISEAYELIRTDYDRRDYFLGGPLPTLHELGQLAGEPEPSRPVADHAVWLRNARRLWLTRGLS